MSYLLDTNVISEVVRPRPAPRVIEWLDGIPPETLHLSVLTLGEIRRGVESATVGRRREKLRVWLERDLPAWFEDRLLPVSVEVADHWGRLLSAVRRPVPAIDSLLAATAQVHGLRLVTRNDRDFRFLGADVLNPWNAP